MDNDKVIPLAPTWEAAARIYTQCLRYGSDEHAADSAQDELITLGQAYDRLASATRADSPKLSSDFVTVNGKPWATMRKARLTLRPGGFKIFGVLVSHDDPRGLKLGEEITTSNIVGISERDMCLVVETCNTRYVIEEGRIEIS